MALKRWPTTVDEGEEAEEEKEREPSLFADDEQRESLFLLPGSEKEPYITGTLIWYYCVCPRQVWLMGRHLTPDEDHPSIELGRFIHAHTYERDKKEITVGHLKMDIIRKEKEQLVVGEVKKSSRHRESARMQLLFYLDELSQLGVSAKGELFFPEEKQREKVILDAEGRAKLAHAKKEIMRILYLDAPPTAEKGPFCKPCGYREFCWA